jgi:hypothetical protein
MDIQAAAKLKWEKERFHKNRRSKSISDTTLLKILLILIMSQCIMTILAQSLR